MFFGSFVLLAMAYFAGLRRLVEKITHQPFETVWWVRWVILSISMKLSFITLAFTIWGFTVLGG